MLIFRKICVPTKWITPKMLRKTCKLKKGKNGVFFGKIHNNSKKKIKDIKKKLNKNQIYHRIIQKCFEYHISTNIKTNIKTKILNYNINGLYQTL